MGGKTATHLAGPALIASALGRPRLLVTGDSMFEHNEQIGSAYNAKMWRGVAAVAAAMHGGVEYRTVYDPSDAPVVPKYDGSSSVNNRGFAGCNDACAGDNVFGLYLRADQVLKYVRPGDIVLTTIGQNCATQGIPQSVWRPNVLKYVKKLTNAGARMIFATVTPRVASSTDWVQNNLDPNSPRNLYYGYNHYLRTEIATMRGVYLADFAQALINPQSTAGSPLANMLADGRHFSNRGAFRCAKVLKALLDVMVPSNPPALLCGLDDTYLAGVRPFGNVFPNPGFLSTGMSQDASVTSQASAGPASWSLTRTTGSTVTASVALEDDPTFGNKRAAITFNNPGGSSGYDVFTFQTVAAMNWAPPVGYHAVTRMRLNASAYAGWGGVRSYLKNNTSNYGCYGFEPAPSGGGAGNITDEAFDMWLDTNPHNVLSPGAAAGSALDAWVYQVQIKLDLSVPGTPTLKFGRPSFVPEAAIAPLTITQ